MLGAEPLSGNWLAIHRAMRDHPLVGFGKPVAPADPKRGSYSRAEAWQDILMLAAYRDTEVMNKGRKMTVGTGEFLGAYDWLASRWNWTMKTVRVFLTKLMDEMMLAKRALVASQNQSKDGSEKGKLRGNQVQVLSVCNYSKYQLRKDNEGQAEGQVEGKRGASQGQESNKITIQQDSSPSEIPPAPAVAGDLLGDPPAQPKPRGRRKSVPEEYTEDFEAFWRLYPRREAKADAFRAWQKLTLNQKRHAYVALKRQVPVLTAKLNDRGKNVCPHPATWINGSRWDDDPVAPPPPSQHPGESMDSLYAAAERY